MLCYSLTSSNSEAAQRGDVGLQDGGPVSSQPPQACQEGSQTQALQLSIKAQLNQSLSQLLSCLITCRMMYTS